MKFELPPLPYEFDALEPTISRETLAYHYGKHHQGYMDKLEAAVKNTPSQDSDLLSLITASTDDSIYNLAAQVWNHSFYWNCMTPNGSHKPSASLANALNEDFDSVENFRQEFTRVAKDLFGSGWVWLVKDTKGHLSIIATQNAKCPLAQGLTPLMTLDVWEHAYYLDYKNARAKYIDAFFDQLINWPFIEKQYNAA